MTAENRARILDLEKSHVSMLKRIEKIESKKIDEKTDQVLSNTDQKMNDVLELVKESVDSTPKIINILWAGNYTDPNKKSISLGNPFGDINPDDLLKIKSEEIEAEDYFNVPRQRLIYLESIITAYQLRDGVLIIRLQGEEIIIIDSITTFWNRVKAIVGGKDA